MKQFLLLLLLATALFSLSSCGPEPKVLVFTKTSGYRHASIEAGVQAIQTLADEHGFEVVATEDSAHFTEENLQQYAAVVFLNTSGDALNNWQQADFQRYIEAGGGFVGIHSAAATEYGWPWYGRLVGAWFDTHPEIQPGTVSVVGEEHPATKGIPADWKPTDEWYNYRPVPPSDKVIVEVPKPLGNTPEKDSLAKLVNNVVPSAAWTFDPKKGFLEANVQVLLNLEESAYKGGNHGSNHPISWCHEFEGGRAFYTGMGHGVDSYADPVFLRHLLGGIRYAMGKGKLDYSKAKTLRIPPQDRFVRTVLASNLNEPTELTVFPDGKVLLVERRGAIKLYDPATEALETVCQLPVYADNEEGLMGVAVDPNWLENRWIYLFYSVYDGPKTPVFVKDGSYHQGRRNRLSRFEFYDNMLHLSTEKILLEVPELIGCCHTGGSIDFDSKGNLFLSTGDNTNPFESDGFGPFDERPGRALWDGQKSAANTNDLRGKILRITPQPNGTYTIPKGNLFAEGTAGTRPEIFVMGCRNPYRLSVDKKTDCVFWGDVGPDAGKDGPQRGSKGYDYFGCACKPGFYGWPFFRGNHIYYDYDFATKQSSGLFDPLKPINNSPFNTGLQELPPVQPPLIWYSYDESYEFPWTATGGKNPMAGPVFHASEFGEGATVFPEYFENKFFAYEWMRHWIYLVTLDENGQYVQADPFLPSEQFSRPMDMAFAPDGSLYVLEYGEQWFASNPDARLNRIEYAPGNRRPVAKIEAGQLVGAAPLNIKLNASSSKDYDGDALTYEWKIQGEPGKSSGAVFEKNFTKPGVFTVELKVTDTNGASSKATVEVAVGNAPPTVAWQLGGNQSFYFDGVKIPYEVVVKDAEDGELGSGIDTKRVSVSIDYLSEGKDIAAVVLGHQTKESAAANLKNAGGRAIIEKNDCGTCHAEDKKINGPSYRDIAGRYYGSEFALNSLSEKVIKGGAGNWGETAMSAHPNLTRAEAEDIVRYILSLAGNDPTGSSTPFAGEFLPEPKPEKAEKGAYVFQASYRDLGNKGEGSRYAKQTVMLRFPKIEAEQYDFAAKGVRRSKADAAGNAHVTDLMEGRFFGFKDIDLTAISTITVSLAENSQPLAGSSIEIRSGSAGGSVVGQAVLKNGTTTLPLKASKSGKQNLYFVLRNEKHPDKEIARVDWIGFGR